jgi:Putative metallopeptidase
MQRILTILAIAAAVTTTHAAMAQSPELHNPQITLRYEEPRYLHIYQHVKARRVLERLDQLLSPLKLDHPLTLSIDEGGESCQSPNSYYDPRKYAVHICYSWIALLEDEVAVQHYDKPGDFGLRTPGLMPGFTRGEVIIGGTVSVALHEIGHAIRHNLNIIRLGREEDTADQMAGFIMLQFGPEVALPTIKGTINAWHHLQAVKLRRGGAITAGEQENEHSLSIQRAYNYLCLAYGSPLKNSFKELADAWLPKSRKDNCDFEYLTVKRAFDATIHPRLDPVLLAKVQAMQIISADDLK